MAKYDWEKAEDDYVYGYVDENGIRIQPTQKQVAKKHKIPIGTVGPYASKHKWEEKRKDKASQIQVKIDEKKSNYQAENIVLSDDKFEDAGEVLRRVSKKKLMQLEGDLEDPEKYVRAYDLKMLGDALKSAQDIVKTAQGEITERIKLDSDSNVNLSILDDEFNQRELEFMHHLIKKD